jgi:peptidoglycan/LPS O-acetylase OafA/YrhL
VATGQRTAGNTATFLGELSYPIYLLHPIFTIFIIPGTTIWAELAVTGTLALSVFLPFAVDRPIEAIRRRRVNDEPLVPHPLTKNGSRADRAHADSSISVEQKSDIVFS